MHAERINFDTQREALELERRDIATLRNRDPIVAAAIDGVFTLFACLARFNADENRILTWGGDRTLRIWSTDVDYRWPADSLELLIEMRTGTRLDEFGQVEALSCDEWLLRKMTLSETIKTNQSGESAR